MHGRGVHGMGACVARGHVWHGGKCGRGHAGADPGFPVGGGADPPVGGDQHMILPNFVKNCMKLRKFWTVGGARAGHASP